MSPFPDEDPLPVIIGTVLPVLLPHAVKTILPSSSKIWIVTLPSKLLALVGV